MLKLIRGSTLVWVACILALFTGGCTKPLLEGQPAGVAEIGPFGGQVRLPVTTPGSPYQEVILTVPAGALREPVLLTLKQVAPFAIDGGTPISEAIGITPHGLHFEKPAELRLPYSPAAARGGEDRMQAWVDSFGQLERVAIAGLTEPAGEAVLELAHLSTYEIIVTAPPMMPPTVDQVNVLYIVDNSRSMMEKQKKLADSIPVFFNELVDKVGNRSRSFRMAFTNTDHVRNFVAGTPDCGKAPERFTNGRLLIESCRSRIAEISKEAADICMASCSAGAVMPSVDYPFISYDKVTKEYRVGTTVVTKAQALESFTCLALVGDGGCNIEAPLEALNSAIDRIAREEPGSKNFFPMAAGAKPNDTDLFLPVFVTDEDDCSVRADRTRDNQLATRSCKPGDPQSPDCFNIDYRCMAESLDCGTDSLMSVGTKATCKLKTNSYLRHPREYAKALSKIVKNVNNQVLVSAIMPLPRVKNNEPKLSSPMIVDLPLKIGWSSDLSPRTTPNLHHLPACQETYGTTMILGYPQLRLSKFACYVRGAVQVSICDLNRYGEVFQMIGKYLNSMVPISSDIQEKCDPLVD